MIFTNRYFEFLQGDDYIDLEAIAARQSSMEEESKQPVKNETSRLLSAFEHVKDRSKYSNKAYNSEKFREMQPKELSNSKLAKFNFDPRQLSYWEEYFG